MPYQCPKCPNRDSPNNKPVTPVPAGLVYPAKKVPGKIPGNFFNPEGLQPEIF